MDEETRQLLARGRECFENGMADEAETLLTEVLQRDLDLADVHNMMGLLAHHRGAFAEAAERFEHALRLNPSYTEAALNLAVTCTDLGDYEQAQHMLRGLQRQRQPNPGEQGALEPFVRGKLANRHAELAQAYAELHWLDEAVFELGRALKLAPGFADLRTRLAQHLHHLGRTEEAKRELQRALHDRPEYVPARLQLGLVLAAQGLVASARETWTEVLAQHPEHPMAKMYLRAYAAPRSEPPPPLTSRSPQP